MPSSRSSYSIIEPHPSLPSAQGRPILTGRGGAGNFSRHNPPLTRGSDASGPPSHISLRRQSNSNSTTSSNTATSFMTGRGGAGNVHRYPAERAMFSFDEELKREMEREGRRAPVYHVGRGGAGNVFHDGQMAKKGSRKGSESEDGDAKSEKSVGSERSLGSESGAEVATRKMLGWAKRVGVH